MPDRQEVMYNACEVGKRSRNGPPGVVGPVRDLDFIRTQATIEQGSMASRFVFENSDDDMIPEDPVDPHEDTAIVCQTLQRTQN